MEILSAIGIIIAAAAGFWFGKQNSSNEVEKNRLEQALSEKEKELEAFHSKVNTHFEKTAELFNHVSDSYQSLYDHMAKSSTQLCASETFQVLPKSVETPPETEENPVFKNQMDSDDRFDANHLYNAHDYRNQKQDEEPESEEQDTNVVEIASAKDDSNEHALDYAIKEKGVINHNSLDIDGVKNS
jgi:uncharacterized membrane-anchored protein YhcB (DUF1043 family)